MKEWQPIDSAPKTGIRVLLYSEDKKVEIGFWASARRSFYIPGIGNIKPTHWAELIQPPK